MAQLTKAVLGRVSGRLGDTVFRQRKGKNVIGTRPARYTPPGDQASIDRRSRFAFSSKLAQAIYSLPELAAFWVPLTPDAMTTFNFVVQKNILIVNPGSVSDLTTITPQRGFGIVCNTASISGNTIAVALAAVGSASGIDVTKEPNAKLAYVLSLTGPANQTFPEFQFVPGISETKPLSLDTAITFNIALSGQDVASFQSYSERKILLTLLTLGPADTPMEYSGTVVTAVTPTL